MAWIRVQHEPEADGELREAYERVASARGRVANILKVVAYFNIVNRIALGLGVELEA